MADQAGLIDREPNSLEAEQAVLGSVLSQPDTLASVVARLRPTDFYYPNHRTIYESMLRLMETNAPIDIISLSEDLSSRGLLARVGGVEVLSKLSDYIALYNLSYYIELVREKSQLRQLLHVFRDMQKEACHEEAQSDSLINLAATRMQEVRANDRTEGFQTMGEVLLDQINEKMRQLKSNEPFFQKTGFASLDNKLDGLRRGSLYILAARPGMGKSALAFNIALQVAAVFQVPTAIFSLEMSAEEVSNRFLSTYALIDSGKLSSGQLSQQEWEKVSQRASEIYALPIYVYDHSGIGPMEMLARCRELKLKEDKLGLVIVDYLQLMSSDGRRQDNRQQEISDISRNLKIMARELDLPVIALSQLSRACESRPNKRPFLSDLRDSGAIEQDADVVFFLYRDDYYQHDEDTMSESGDQGQAELIIAKNRHGETGTIYLGWRPQYTLFYDLATANRDQEAPPF